MSRVSDKQLVALIERRNVDPADPRFVSEEWLQSFLDGHLVHRDAASAAVIEGGGTILDISPLVEKMIKAGIHTVTDNGNGMGAAKYRKLWPKTVVQPAEYAGRFDHVLLVDTTVALAAMVEKGNVYVYTDPASCEDIVPAPMKEEGTPTPLTRYIAFFQDGTKNKGRTVEDCRTTFAKDEIGLVTREGLYLPIQHESILRDHGVDLSGSRRGGCLAPFVVWFVSVRPEFHVHDIQRTDTDCSSASRGSVVIAVT